MAFFDDLYSNGNYIYDRQHDLRKIKLDGRGRPSYVNSGGLISLFAGNTYKFTISTIQVTSGKQIRYSGSLYLADYTLDPTGNTEVAGTPRSTYEIDVNGVIQLSETDSGISYDITLSLVIPFNLPKSFKRIDVRILFSSGSNSSNTDNANTSVALETFSDNLLGQLFYSSHNTPSTGLLYMGETYNWADNPKLKNIFDANNHEFINDNGDGTFVVAQHSDFLRAGENAIGTHVDDTTAVNGLSGTYIRYNTIPTNSSTGGNNGRWRGTSTRAIALSGDAETAPDHRNAFFGIYGDF